MAGVSRRGFLAGAAAAAAAATLGAPRVHAQKKGGTIRFIPHADLKVLDPVATTAYITRNHSYFIYDTLFGTDADLAIKPQMVAKYASSNKGLKWSFTLRDGLKFHDGAAVTAEDAVESLKRWAKKDPLGRLLAAHMAKIAPSDRKTFTLELSQPPRPRHGERGAGRRRGGLVGDPAARLRAEDRGQRRAHDVRHRPARHPGLDPSEPQASALQQQEGAAGAALHRGPAEVSQGGHRRREVLQALPRALHVRRAVRIRGRRARQAGPRPGPAARQGVRLRRTTGRRARPERHRAHPRRRAGHARAAEPDRLQRGSAGDGLVVGGRAPREEGAAAAGRVEHAVHVVDRLRRDQPRRPRRHLGRGRRRVVRLAGERAHRGAEGPVGARHRPREAEAARRGDPESRLRRGDVRAVRPVGAAHRPPQGGEWGAPVPGAAVLERVDRLIVFPEILRRLVATIPVMGVVAIAVFALLHVTPGDPAVIIAGDYATSEDIAKIRAKLGLDQPFLTQVGIWLGRIVRGDLGTSIYSGLPVTTLIGQRAEATIALTLVSMLISVSVAVPLGVLAAWKKGSLVDRAVMVFAVSGFSMPTFWLGFVLVYIFAVSFHWLPVQGFSPIEKPETANT